MIIILIYSEWRDSGAASLLFRIIDLALAKLSEALNVNCRNGVVSADGVDNDETELEEAVRQGLN